MENIAHILYFSYLSALYLCETLGTWRPKTFLKAHFSEEWNKLHRLLIMEDLGVIIDSLIDVLHKVSVLSVRGSILRLISCIYLIGTVVVCYWLVCFKYLFK